MAKYNSNRQQNLKIGISSYTEDKTVLEITGKVGIGTTNAQYSLDVVGDINFTGTFYEDGNQFIASRWTSGDGTEIYRLSNVGIGTTNPTEDLDVAGDVRIRGSLYDKNNQAGTSGQLLVSTETGVDWQDANAISVIQNILNTTLTGIGVSEEGIGIGTAFTSFNFIGAGVTVSANGTSVNVDVSTVSNTEVSTSVIGGIGSITQLNVTGVSTLGSVKIFSGIISATSGIVTYYGDGSNLQGVVSFNVISQNNTSSPVFPTFASNIGVSSVGISTDKLVFIPSSGNLGIGTTNPTEDLDVAGDVRIRGGLYDFNHNVGTAKSVLISTGIGISWVDVNTIIDVNWNNDNSFGSITNENVNSEDLGDINSEPEDSYDFGVLTNDGTIAPDTFVLPSFTVSTLPTVNPAGQMLFVTDDTGGSIPAFSDGTHWRRVTDRQIVS
jgi:hypothetical protein